jgi:hypothetical protein
MIQSSSGSPWGRFASIFLTVAVCALVCTCFLNYLVDPDGTCGTHLLPQYVLNARPVKLYLLDVAQPSPNALIFGSSRVMTLDPVQVSKETGLITFNAAVDSARSVKNTWEVDLKPNSAYAVALAGMLVISILFLGNASPFLYFQF